MQEVTIGDRKVGAGHKCYVIAEIGINHNGVLANAQKMIHIAAAEGCQAVKFQKRTITDVYTKEELERPRESVYGNTNGELKQGLEFGYEDYQIIDVHCKEQCIEWFASCWDVKSIEFMEQFAPPAHKVASALLTDHQFLRELCRTGRPLIISTGMSTLSEIDAAMEVVTRYPNDVVLLHCTSTYPAVDPELNLRCIPALKNRYGVPIGYSGHERGIATTVAAVALGACMVERHVTLDRSMWGSDQSASLEPYGLARLVRDIRAVEAAMGDGVKKVYKSELPIKAKLRRDTTHV